MKIDWRNLSWAMMISIIATGISGLIRSMMYTIVAIPDIPPGKLSITIGTVYPPPYLLSLPAIIVLGLTCNLVLTLASIF